jgi:hypothetical protein
MPQKTFFRLIDLCMLNAHSLYQVHVGEKICPRIFHLEAIQGLLETFEA